MDPKPNEMMTCPFNKSHRVERYRMQFHVEKCRKQYLDSQDKAMCPFDSTHIVHVVELDYHVLHCNKRAMFDQIKYRIDDETTVPHVATAGLVTSSNLQGDENWDDEFVSNYNPEMAKKGAHIITKIKGATPSERRRARMEGIKNYRPLSDGSNNKE